MNKERNKEKSICLELASTLQLLRSRESALFPVQHKEELDATIQHHFVTQHLADIGKSQLTTKSPIEPTYFLRSSESVRTTSCIAINCDNTYLASTHGDHTVKIWKISSGDLIQVLRGHPRTCWNVRFHPTNPTILASTCWGGHVRIWSIETIDTESNNSSGNGIRVGMGFEATDGFQDSFSIDEVSQINEDAPSLRDLYYSNNTNSHDNHNHNLNMINYSYRNHPNRLLHREKTRKNKIHDKRCTSCIAIMKTGNSLCVDFTPCGKYLIVCSFNRLLLWRWGDACPVGTYYHTNTSTSTSNDNDNDNDNDNECEEYVDANAWNALLEEEHVPGLSSKFLIMS